MINEVILVGRLTRDPDLKFTNDGKAFTHITLAVTRQFRNPNGELDTDFVQCILWRKTAENTALYCQKGSCIGVIGRIQTRNYENQEGRRVYVTEVVGDNVQFLSKKTARNQNQDHPTQQRLVQGQVRHVEQSLGQEPGPTPVQQGLEQEQGRSVQQRLDQEPVQQVPGQETGQRFAQSVSKDRDDSFQHRSCPEQSLDHQVEDERKHGKPEREEEVRPFEPVPQ